MRLANFAPSAVSSRKKLLEDCRIKGRRITEIKLNRSRFVTSMLLCTFPTNLLGQ